LPLAFHARKVDMVVPHHIVYVWKKCPERLDKEKIDWVRLALEHR
jgi:hypothetical protein